MQNRPDLPSFSHPINLPENFPAIVTELFEQTDRPITHLHWHDVVEIGYCHEGCGIFVVGNKMFPYNKYDIIAISGKSPHLAQSKQGSSSLWTWIYCDPMRLFSHPFCQGASIDMSFVDSNNFSMLFPASQYPQVQHFILAIIDEFKNRGVYYEQAVCNLFSLFFTHVYRSGPCTSNGLHSANSKKQFNALQRIKPALDEVCTSYSNQLTVEDLAYRCCMSVTNFRRVFQSAVAKTPQEYIIHVRISMAMAELKNSNRSIADIALSCGFITLSSFNRSFKALMKKTPREWRNESTKNRLLQS